MSQGPRLGLRCRLGVPRHLRLLCLQTPTEHAQVDSDGVFHYATSKWFPAALEALKATGVRGMAIDVWVGRLPALQLITLLS